MKRVRCMTRGRGFAQKTGSARNMGTAATSIDAAPRPEASFRSGTDRGARAGNGGSRRAEMQARRQRSVELGVVAEVVGEGRAPAVERVLLGEVPRHPRAVL